MRSRTVTQTINVLEYYAPTLSIEALRSGRDNNQIQVVRNVKIAPISIPGYSSITNFMKLQLYTRPLSGGNWTFSEGGSGQSSTINSLVASRALLSGTFDATRSYEVRAVLEDAFMTVSVVATVGSEGVVLSYTPKGVGVGKIWEQGGLDVNGDVHVSGKVYVNNKELKTPDAPTDIGPQVRSIVNAMMAEQLLKMYPVGSIYISTSATSPESFLGGKWERYAKGRTLVGVDEGQFEFRASGNQGGSKDLPLPNVGGAGTGTTNKYLSQYNLAYQQNDSNKHGWNIISNQEAMPAVEKVSGYDKLQPYIAVYIWRRLS